MNVGAFVCSCGGSCDVDLETARDGVRDVEVVASSELLCRDGLPAMEKVVDEYDLDQLVVTAPDAGCQATFDDVLDRKGLHPDAAAYVDHRESAAWVHDAAEATDKTARLLNAEVAGLKEEPVSRTIERDAGDSVAVVGDPETAAALSDSADVTLVADGEEYAGADADLDDVAFARGEVVAVEGSFGDFEVTLASRVTEDCISCLDCVREGPEGVTARPVQIPADAPDGEWTDVCPTDAIDLDGVTRTLAFDQVVYPGGTAPARGGQMGFYTGPVDAGTVAAVESLLGGVEKPAHLDLDMEVCAAGASSQEGCTACVDACPHEAVSRPAIDEVEFDLAACQDCGACTSACPTGATRLRDPSNERIAREVEALLTSEADDGGWLFSRGTDGIETEVVAFVCSERAADRLREYGRRARRDDDISYPPILPVRVNCTDTVGEAHVMHALAAGADGVAVVGCGDSCLHSGPDPKAELVERLDRATADLGLGERVTFLAPGPSPEPFCADLESFVDGLEDSPIPSGEHEATGTIDDPDRENDPFDSHAWTLESVRALLEHVEPEREVIRGLKDFGLMEVSDACNLTPTCTNLCPTGAIQRTDDGDLLFNHERCVNCELCEEGCPETAITMRQGLDLSLLPENRTAEEAPEQGPAWSRVYEGEMAECVRCGDPFTSQGSVDKVRAEVGDVVEGIAPDASHSVFEYCGDCRSRLLFEGGEKR
ncbi:hydrogenase iron-sulfur subunit [Natronomonas salina]|uniref:4Fe-4S dicluster domain-containing protein n=1 Tax=Natronomonas salina TaxID=1710540 RepID=UPI0015B52383|nr:hydrogenase iron-sulfur subunit [Natronomonas salina]QLD87974.1 hydrogenase iron-sulfur subunit [Natronomonas salina]